MAYKAHVGTLTEVVASLNKALFFHIVSLCPSASMTKYWGYPFQGKNNTLTSFLFQKLINQR